MNPNRNPQILEVLYAPNVFTELFVKDLLSCEKTIQKEHNNKCIA